MRQILAPRVCRHCSRKDCNLLARTCTHAHASPQSLNENVVNKTVSIFNLKTISNTDMDNINVKLINADPSSWPECINKKKDMS